MQLGPGIPYFHFLGLGFPYNPLKAKKGSFFVPRILPGRGDELQFALNGPHAVWIDVPECSDVDSVNHAVVRVSPCHVHE